MNKTAPYLTNEPVKLIVMNADNSLPANFALMGTRAEKKVAIRLAGGCKNMSLDDKEYMLSFFSNSFKNFNGLIWSGATRQVDDNDCIDPMITDVPGIIAKKNSGCIALGTVPRTAMLTLRDNSRLVLDDWGTAPNPDMHGILIVQKGPDGELGWDGDVETYIAMMRNWKDYAGFTALGLISWNGGEVTRKEINKVAKLGWPTILIKGSGRVTDEMANTDKFTSLKNVYVIDKDNPSQLLEFLMSQGFIN